MYELYFKFIFGTVVLGIWLMPKMGTILGLESFITQKPL